MNKDILNALENEKQKFYAEDQKLRLFYKKYKEENRPVSEINALVREIRVVDEKYNTISSEIKSYKEMWDNVMFNNIPDPYTKEEYLKLIRTCEQAIINKYSLDIELEEILVDELNDQELDEVEEVVEPKKSFMEKYGAWILGLAAVFGIGVAVGNADFDDEDVMVDEDEKPFESYGEFTDASNVELLNERADVYIEKFINPVYGEMNKVEKDSVTKENLVDIMQVVNGEVPEGFEVNEVINYNNKLVQMFTSYLSTEDRTKNGNIGYMPSAYLYEDGSHEQKCAMELDAVMEPLIKAINEGDDANYIKYATEFGELMKNQYYLVDNTSEHYNVRSIASYPSRIQLYGLSYSYYTTSILEYGLVRDIDICIPFCIDYNTKEMVDVPLSKLMATLEFVPMSEWDAVIKRSGISIKQLEQMGNKNVTDTMPYVFTQDAKNHFREKTLSLRK